MSHHRTDAAWLAKLRQFDLDWEADEVAPYSANAIGRALSWGIAAALVGFLALHLMGVA